jgi:hypothetical protein
VRPRELSVGVQTLLINGALSIQDGKLTAVAAGRAPKHTPPIRDLPLRERRHPFCSARSLEMSQIGPAALLERERAALTVPDWFRASACLHATPIDAPG